MSISWLFVGEVKGKGVICFGLTEDEADEIDDDSVEADVNAMFSDINPHGIIEVLKRSMRIHPGADGLPVRDGIVPIIWRRATEVEVEDWGGYQLMWDEVEHILCGYMFPVVGDFTDVGTGRAHAVPCDPFCKIEFVWPYPRGPIDVQVEGRKSFSPEQDVRIGTAPTLIL